MSATFLKKAIWRFAWAVAGKNRWWRDYLIRALWSDDKHYVIAFVKSHGNADDCLAIVKLLSEEGQVDSVVDVLIDGSGKKSVNQYIQAMEGFFDNLLSRMPVVETDTMNVSSERTKEDLSNRLLNQFEEWNKRYRGVEVWTGEKELAIFFKSEKRVGHEVVYGATEQDMEGITIKNYGRVTVARVNDNIFLGQMALGHSSGPYEGDSWDTDREF